MFNMNPRHNRPIIVPIVASIVPVIKIKHVHSSASYQWAIYQNTISVIVKCLVGMGLNPSLIAISRQKSVDFYVIIVCRIGKGLHSVKDVILQHSVDVRKHNTL